MSKISFIIPVYNSEIYIKACVNNIQAIKLDEYEIILVDDGSTDLSGEICEQLATQDNHIRVIHQENAGASSARNRGLESASGEYIIFIDVDDSLESQELKKLINTMTSREDVDLMLYGISFDYYKNTKCYREEHLVYPIEGKLKKEEWCSQFHKLFMVNSLSPVWNKIFKREIIERNNLRFDTNLFLYEDLDFVFKYMSHCDVIFNSTAIVYHYRQPEDEANAKRRVKKIEHLPTFMRIIENSLDDMIYQADINEINVCKEMKRCIVRIGYWLLKDRVTTADNEDVRVICKEIKEWCMEHKDLFEIELSEKEQEWINKVKNEQVFWLRRQQKIIEIRHTLAVKVKSFIKN